MIRITDDLFIDDAALAESFIRASGPGGQNVNKVASAVQLRLDLAQAARACPAMDAAFLARLKKIAGRRMTRAGEIVIEARRFRAQDRNRDDALNRLIDLLVRASRPPRARKKTRTPKGERARRLENKKHRGTIKKTRAPLRPGEDG